MHVIKIYLIGMLKKLILVIYLIVLALLVEKIHHQNSDKQEKRCTKEVHLFFNYNYLKLIKL